MPPSVAILVSSHCTEMGFLPILMALLAVITDNLCQKPHHLSSIIAIYTYLPHLFLQQNNRNGSSKHYHPLHTHLSLPAVMAAYQGDWRAQQQRSFARPGSVYNTLEQGSWRESLGRNGNYDRPTANLAILLRVPSNNLDSVPALLVG